MLIHVDACDSPKTPKGGAQGGWGSPKNKYESIIILMIRWTVNEVYGGIHVIVRCE